MGDTAYVYKALNTCFARQMQHPRDAHGDKLTMLFCGAAYAPAKLLVEQVILGVGFSPVFVGSIRFARNLEALAELTFGAGYGADFHLQAGGVPVGEYSPRSVKQAIVGRGGADKVQVQHMVKILLGLPELPQEDAADALAVALCHHHTQSTLNRMSGLQG